MIMRRSQANLFLRFIMNNANVLTEGDVTGLAFPYKEFLAANDERCAVPVTPPGGVFVAPAANMGSW